MTGLDTKALELCAKAQSDGLPIPSQARIELYAAQLLLFGQEFGSDTYSDVFSQLLSAAAEERGESSHTALAALVALLSAGHAIHHARVIDKALSTAGIQQHSANLDVQIALANLIWNSKLNGSDFPEAQRLLTSSGTTIAERYDRLHLELASLDGRPHSTPLKRFQNTRMRHDECQRRLTDALHSLDQHEDLLLHIDVAWARSPGSAIQRGSVVDLPNENMSTKAMAEIRSTLNSEPKRKLEPGFVQYREEMLEKLRDTRTALESFNCQESTAIPAAIMLRSAAIENVQKVCSDMAKLARTFLFLHLERESIFSRDRPLEAYLMTLFNRIDFNEIFNVKNIEGRKLTLGISMDSDVKLQEQVCSVDLVWDRHVEDAIEHFMSNSIYATNGITDPWGGKLGEQNDLWVSVTYDEASATIHFCNECTDSPSTIEAKQARHCGRWHRIEEIGGAVRFGEHESNSDVFKVSLSIPYAGYCRSVLANRYI
jgi:hypothetical protein